MTEPLEGWTAENIPSDFNGAALTVPFDKIPSIPATYLWPGVIPNRTVTLLAGPGGTGKGLTIATIEALVTTGAPFPGETGEHEPGQIIKIAPEDDPNEDVSFRLTAAGANLALVRNLTVLPNGALFRLPDNTDELYQAIAEINDEGGFPVRLLTLDPLLSMCRASLLRSDPRAVIEPLQALAQETGIAILASHHTTKDRNTIAGGQALTDAARQVWMISVAKDDPDARVMSVWKTNRKAHPGLRFRIEGDDEEARVVFTGADTAVPGSRAARLRLYEAPLPDLTEAPADRARRILATLDKKAAAPPDTSAAAENSTPEEISGQQAA